MNLEPIYLSICLFIKKLNSGVHYKVNIYAVVDKKDEDFEVLESKELHEKIIQVN